MIKALRFRSKIFKNYHQNLQRFTFTTQQQKKHSEQNKSTESSNLSPSKSYLQTVYKHSIKSKTPCFTLQSHHIQIIEDPLQFYISVKKGIESSCYKIGLSSLYLGTGTLERFLLSSIKKRKQTYPKLDVTMLFDYNRSHRVQNGQSGIQMLSNWRSSFAFTDQILIGFNKNSSNTGIFGQISGVHHQKICVFDDQVILGGANLSKSYFLNRKDRYMKFNHCQDLSAYLYDYLKIIAQNSYQIEGGTNLKSPKVKTNLEKHYKLWNMAYRPDQYKQFFIDQEKYLNKKHQQLIHQKSRGFEQKKQKKSQLVLNRNQQIAKQLGTSIEIRKQIYQKQYKERINTTRTRLFGVSMQETISNELANIENGPEEDTDLMEKGQKVFIFPFVHYPKFKEVNQPELYNEVLQTAKDNGHNIKISSGYMNFTQSIIQRLVRPSQKNTSKIQLICSAPQANSFYQGGKFKKYIPFFYRCFQIELLKKKISSLSIKEFNNSTKLIIIDQWSFHAKGTWIKEADNSFLTVIGSSNYNQRSLTRDTQMQFYLYSSCQKFNKRLDIQWNNISQNCKQVKLQDLQQDQEIKCSWVVKLMSKLFKKFL